MRLDKYLKVSRIVKRRTIAKEMADNGRVFVNDKVAKSSTNVEVDDTIVVVNVPVSVAGGRMILRND